MSWLQAVGLACLLSLSLVPAKAETRTPLQPKGWTPPFVSDHTEIAPDGTAYIQRVVPIPKTISMQAQHWLARPVSPKSAPLSLAQWREREDVRRHKDGSVALRKYPADILHSQIAGVPVTIVTPPAAVDTRRDFVLIDVHGGAFEVDCCSLVESIPLAHLLGAEVIAVHYRLAPEHPFPAGIDDVIAVYRAVLKTHSPSAVAIFGTSSGAAMTGEIAVALKRRLLPEPGALGIFSGPGDFSIHPDSRSFFTLDGLRGQIDPHAQGPLGVERNYIGTADPTDPLVSPTRGDLSGLPPTLFLTGTRDGFLGDVSLFDRAMLRAGDETQLVVFDAMPHAFWVDPDLPESEEAYQIMARFFKRHLHSHQHS